MVFLTKSNNEKEHKEIAMLWDKTKEHTEYNEWDYLHTINALYALKQYEKCLDVYKECYKRFPDCTMLDDKAGWSLYHTKIKTFDFNKQDISELSPTIDFILKHCVINPNKPQFCPRWRVIDTVTDAIIDRKNGEETDWAMVEKYLLEVDPELLSKEENQAKDGRPLASNYEKWYSRMSKSLLEQGKYEECLRCCDRALGTITKFHSNNDVWFKYRKAKSLRETGNETEGTRIINNALPGKFSHWCLYEYLFDNAKNANDEKSANVYGAKCSLSDREHKMRVTFYEKYAAFLENQKSIRETMLLRQLVVLIRKEEGWNLKSYFADWNINEAIQKMSKSEILKELNAFWKSYADCDKIVGTIISIIQDGAAGFVEDQFGNTYYFKTNQFKANKSKMVIGQSVKFRLVDGFNKKKNQKTKDAVDITL